MSHTASFMPLVVALQTIPCCDALLPAPGGHDVRWEAGASALLHHTDDTSGPCSGGSDYLDRQSRPRLPWLFTCPAQRLAQLANALPPLFLRRGLRLRQSQQRPPSEDGSTPASTSFYMMRGGVLRTEASSQLEPLSGRDLFLPEGRDIPRLMQAFREVRRSLWTMPRSATGGFFNAPPSCPPMFKAPGQRRQLPLTPRHMLLVDDREWRRGSVDRLVKTFLYFLGGRPLCFRRSLCLRPSEERLTLTAAYDSIISVLRRPVRLPFLMGGATFSSHVPRNAGPAHLPLVRDAAIRLHDYGRRPGKDSALYYLQNPARMQTRLYTPSRIGPRLHFCLCLDHASRSHWSKPSSFGRAGFGFQTLLAHGRELGRRCCRKSCTLHCPSLRDRDWGACYCRSASLQRRACRPGRRRRRRHIAHCKPPRGWRLLCRWHTLRVVTGGYVRRRLLCPSLTWPCCYSRNGRRWHTPLRWSSRASSGRHCGLHRSVALIVTIACAASTCLGAPFSLTAGLCGALSISSVGVCLALLLGLTNLVALYWSISHVLLRSSTSSHIYSAFICRCIRSLRAMSLQTSLSYFSRASWGPNPQGAVDFCFFFFLYLYSRVRQFTPPQSRGLSRLPHPRREPFQRYLHASQLWRSLVDFMVFPMGLGSAPFVGHATGSRRQGPMDIPGIAVADVLQPTSVFSDRVLRSLPHSTLRVREKQ